MSSSSVILYETRQGKSVKPPPPVTSKYIVKDTGNCSPCYIRCTLNQVLRKSVWLIIVFRAQNLLKLSSMPLALMVQPLALPDPSEDPIPVVDFGESGPVRCCCCRGYMNPFMEFVDNGKSFVCNFCGVWMLMRGLSSVEGQLNMVLQWNSCKRVWPWPRRIGQRDELDLLLFLPFLDIFFTVLHMSFSVFQYISGCAMWCLQCTSS